MLDMPFALWVVQRLSESNHMRSVAADYADAQIRAPSRRAPNQTRRQQ
jgi:hypothetical protein